MLDTVVLCIHDLKKHKQIYQYLLMKKAMFSKKHIDGNFDVEQTTHFLSRDILHYEMSGKAKESFKYLVNYTPSWSYKLIFALDKASDCIIVNFSLPKYFLGTNVFQLVKSPMEMDFKFTLGDREKIPYQEDLMYERFGILVKYFFSKEFPLAEVDYTRVQVKRIDLCYNLHFDNREKAFEYLNLLKNVTKKYMRDGSSVPVNYDESIFFHTKDYSCKVYHKGSEFAKHDAKELKCGNNEINELQTYADRILRYEMTFRAHYISKLFNETFRKDDIVYRSLKRLYNIISARLQKNKEVLFYTDTNGKIIKKVPIGFQNADYKYWVDVIKKLQKYSEHLKMTWLQYLYKETKQNWNLANDSLGLKVLRLFHNDYSSFQNKTHKFYLKQTVDDKEVFPYYRKDRKLEHYDRHLFGREVLGLCFKKFNQFVTDFTVNEIPKDIEFKEKLKHYNANRKAKVDESKYIMLYFILQKYRLNQIKSMLSISDATFYRYKKVLKELGVSVTTVAKEVPKCDFTFKDYWLFLSNEQNFVNKFFKIFVRLF